MKTVSAGIAMLFALCATASAQEAANTTTLSLELNAVKQIDDACQMTFLVRNQLGADIDDLAFEFALFGADGGIQQLVTLDFNGVATNKTRVLQFAIPQLACSSLTRILVNGATACAGPALAKTACIDKLVLNGRPDISFDL